jgi:hypothetical protein
MDKSAPSSEPEKKQACNEYTKRCLLQLRRRPLIGRSIVLLLSLLLLCAVVLRLIVFKTNHHDSLVALVEHQYQYYYYEPIRKPSDTYTVFNCPETPPRDYPREYPILDVRRKNKKSKKIIHQGVCVFDFAKLSTSNVTVTKTRIQIQKYRAAEVPFVVRNDPAVIESAVLWSNIEYLSERLQGKLFQATLANTTTMQYYSMTEAYNAIPEDFVPPTLFVPMSFTEWCRRATSDQQHHHKEYAREPS